MFQIDCDDLASEEPSFMKAVDWRSIYTAGQMIYFVYRQIIYCTGKASTSKQIKMYLQIFFPIALKCYGVARTGVKMIYIWDLAQMILFIKSYDRYFNQSSFMKGKNDFDWWNFSGRRGFYVISIDFRGRLLDLGICRGNPLCSCESLSSIIQRRVITY